MESRDNLMKNRRLWFLVHGWFSLPVWLLFCFICLTGTIAVFSHELTWLTNPAARAVNPHNLPARPLHELIGVVEQTVEGADVSFALQFEPYMVTAVYFSSPSIPQAIAYVNPYTAEIQMVNQGLTFIDFMRSLHSWLLFPWQHSYSWGYYLVSAMSVVVLGGAITGLVIYKRFWRALWRPTIRFNRGARTLLGDLHRTTGVWSLWFLLIMGLTGLWYLAQALMWHHEIEIAPEITPLAAERVPLLPEGAGLPTPITFSSAQATAEGMLPGVRLHWAQAPEHNRDYYTFAGSGGEVFFDNYAHRVKVDPWTGAVASVVTPASMAPLQAVSHIADPLHYGTLAGLWTKVLWFLSGVMLSGMSITGFLIWSKRTFREVRGVAAAPSAAAAVPNWKSAQERGAT